MCASLFRYAVHVLILFPVVHIKLCTAVFFFGVGPDLYHRKYLYLNLVVSACVCMYGPFEYSDQ